MNSAGLIDEEVIRPTTSSHKNVFDSQGTLKGIFMLKFSENKHIQVIQL